MINGIHDICAVTKQNRFLEELVVVEGPGGERKRENMEKRKTSDKSKVYFIVL